MAAMSLLADSAMPGEMNMAPAPAIAAPRNAWRRSIDGNLLSAVIAFPLFKGPTLTAKLNHRKAE